MQSDTIYVTANDAKRLQAQLEAAKRSRYYGSNELKNLGAELNRATVVASTEISPEIFIYSFS